MTILQDVYAALGPLFPGFQLDKDKEGFVRTIAEGRQEILVPFVDRSPRFVFGLTLCIRLDPVEDICNRFNEAAARYHRQTVTTITPLSYFGRDRLCVLDTGGTAGGD